MGFWDWVQKKSSDKCRDNLVRGFPMFIEVCERISACQENQVNPSDADLREARRLYDMLWINLTNRSLSQEEILAMFVPLLHNPNKFSKYTHSHLVRLCEAFHAEMKR